MHWQQYFKLVKLVPGKVIVPEHGTIDFSKEVPVKLCQQLWENDFEFLQITEEGKRVLYGVLPPPPTGEDPSIKGEELKPETVVKETPSEKKKKPKRMPKKKV